MLDSLNGLYQLRRRSLGYTPSLTRTPSLSQSPHAFNHVNPARLLAHSPIKRTPTTAHTPSLSRSRPRPTTLIRNFSMPAGGETRLDAQDAPAGPITVPDGEREGWDYTCGRGGGNDCVACGLGTACRSSDSCDGDSCA